MNFFFSQGNPGPDGPPGPKGDPVSTLQGKTKVVNAATDCSQRFRVTLSSALCVFHQGDPGDEGDIGGPGPSGLHVR